MSIKSALKKMRTDIRSAYKSEDTEEFFDRIFTKPLGYLWALLFMRLGWTPNMVTILSMAIGFAGGWLFVIENIYVNLAGVLMIIWANVLDSTDGQLARLTGNKSTIGRILDALSTTTWYISIYISLCLRLMNKPIPLAGGAVWGGWIFLLAVFCALFAHERQCMMADYFRNLHLYMLKGKNGSELDKSGDIASMRAKIQWRGSRFRKVFLYFYGMYTYIQELSTPDTQRLLAGLEKADAESADRAREDFLSQSRKYIQLTNILTFNARAYTLFACVLLNVPLLYFAIELFVFGGLLRLMCAKYKRIAVDVLYVNRLPGCEKEPVKRKKSTVVFFTLGLAGVILMLYKTDISQIDWSGVLRLMPVWLPSIIAVWALIYIVHTMSYAVILGKERKKTRIMHLFKVTLSGFAMNKVTPVGLAGGEPYRIMELKPFVGVETATATALTFTVMHVFSHIMFWLTGALLYIVTIGAKGGWLTLVLAAVIAALCLLLCAVFFKNGRKALVAKTIGLLSKIPLLGRYFKKLSEKSGESIRAIDREMAEFHGHRKQFTLTVLLEYAARALEVFEFYLIFRILSVDISFGGCWLAMACASLLGNLMFFMPMQVGSREAGLALSLGWLGVNSSFGITASLLARIRELFYIAVGVGIMLIKGGTKVDSKEESA